MTEEFGLFIGGKWTTPEGTKRFVTRNPATGEELGSFVSGTEKDATRAIDAAQNGGEE